MPAPVIAAVAFDGISPFHLSVPCLIFGENRTGMGLPRFDFRVCSLEGGTTLGTGTSLGLVVSHGLEGISGADIVIVPSWRDVGEEVPAELCTALVEAHARGATIVGLCLGAFVLAAAGLLDGRPATTHWAHAELLSRKYPAVAVHPRVLYVDAGSVITSAGVAAALDCCLHILRRRHGADAAQRVARSLVLPPHRQGGQAQYIERPMAAGAGNDDLGAALETVLASLESPHSLDSVAGLARMTRRTFTRRFQRRNGMSFAKWLNQQRVLRAQELLETTGRSVEDIAQMAGFGTAASLRQHFAAQLATSPAQYRREFARHP